MNADRIVALRTQNDQARRLRPVFPICNRYHLNRRIHATRPMAETLSQRWRFLMKRLSLVTMLLLGGAMNAYADSDSYTNMTRHPRSDEVLQADTSYCSQVLGAPQSGTPTSRAYKRCMSGRGWRFGHTVREPHHAGPYVSGSR
jgi:hypothetical protein